MFDIHSGKLNFRSALQGLLRLLCTLLCQPRANPLFVWQYLIIDINTIPAQGTLYTYQIHPMVS